MNQFHRALYAICMLLCAAAPATAQRLYVVGVPSETDADTGKKILNATVELALKARDGDRLMVFDALNLQKVADLAIPHVPGDSDAKVRIVRLNKEIAALKAYFTRSASVRSGKATHVKMPQFLELVGSSIKSASGDTTVLLFGSPYYLEARDGAFTFSGGSYPSDGHLLATSKRSIFGTADKRNLLKGTRVHFCHLNDDVFTTELERTAVRRFWKLYADQLGAVLGTFSPSIDMAVERTLSNVTDAVSQDEVDPKDSAIEMRQTVVTVQRETTSEVQPKAREESVGLNDVRDQHGNVRGSNHDLILDGQMKGQRIIIATFLRDSDVETSPLGAALAAKGFAVEEMACPLPALAEFEEALDRAQQFWLWSSTENRLPKEHLQALVQRWKGGKLAMCLLADNTPYCAEAAEVLAAIAPGATLGGDYVGGENLRARQNQGGGFSADSPLFHEIATIFEGATVSSISGPGLVPVCYSSNGAPLIATLEQRGTSRLVVHGGFTSFYKRFWEDAGIRRFAMNCAGWLSGANPADSGRSPGVHIIKTKTE